MPWQSITAGSILHSPAAGVRGAGENLIVPVIEQAAPPSASAVGTDPASESSTRPRNKATSRFKPSPLVRIRFRYEVRILVAPTGQTSVVLGAAGPAVLPVTPDGGHRSGDTLSLEEVSADALHGGGLAR